MYAGPLGVGGGALAQVRCHDAADAAITHTMDISSAHTDGQLTLHLSICRPSPCET